MDAHSGHNFGDISRTIATFVVSEDEKRVIVKSEARTVYPLPVPIVKEREL
tara:strand:+ start:303 stop:455 length:153 start_codon:yes stop_codon:yes gene_type:complete